MTLSRASVDYIARKAKRGRRSVIREERVGPTPETAAKLLPDPFNVLIESGDYDTAQRDAGLEIRAIWYAVTGALSVRAGDRGARRSGGGMPEALADVHALVYVPWAREWGRAIGEVIDLVVDARHPTHPRDVGRMLADYARRRRIYMGKTKKN